MDMGTPRLWRRQDTTEGSLYLKRILQLHNAGWPSTKIGKKEGKDHSTILYHLRKLGVTPRGRGYCPPVQVSNLNFVGQNQKYDYLLNEPINPGKSYREYLKAAGKSKADIKRITAVKAKGGVLEDIPLSSIPRLGDF